MTDLSELRERLEKAEGPSEKLDQAIYLALRYPDKADPLRAQADIYMGPYTSSLDAAVALVERVLPGWDWQINAYGFAVICKDGVDTMYAGEGFAPDEYVGNAQTPALALCTALLCAMEADDADT